MANITCPGSNPIPLDRARHRDSSVPAARTHPSATACTPTLPIVPRRVAGGCASRRGRPGFCHDSPHVVPASGSLQLCGVRRHAEAGVCLSCGDGLGVRSTADSGGAPTTTGRRGEPRRDSTTSYPGPGRPAGAPAIRQPGSRQRSGPHAMSRTMTPPSMPWPRSTGS